MKEVDPCIGKSMADIKAKTSFTIPGCLALGIGFCIALLSVSFFHISALLGIFAAIGLLLYGSEKSKRYVCSSCGNSVPNKKTAFCPSCKVSFTRSNEPQK